MQPTEVNISDRVPLVSKIPPGEAGKVAEKFVDAFASLAQRAGIRSISMNDLAKSLQVSKKTLYKYFPSKEDMVYELVVRWEYRLNTPIHYEGRNIIDAMRHWVDRWISNDAQYSSAFWRDLRDEYPELYKIYSDSLALRLRFMRKHIAPYLRNGVDEDFAFVAYRSLVTQAARPKMFERLNITREECVHKAVDLWTAAVLDEDKIHQGQA